MATRKNCWGYSFFNIKELLDSEWVVLDIRLNGRDNCISFFSFMLKMKTLYMKIFPSFLYHCHKCS